MKRHVKKKKKGTREGEPFIRRSRWARELSCVLGLWQFCRAETAQHIMKLRQFCGGTSTCNDTFVF